MKIENNIFRILSATNNHVGNGFIIRDGYALTNSHVLRHGGIAALINDKTTAFKIICDFRENKKDLEDEKLDYALLYSEEFKLKDSIKLSSNETKRYTKLLLLAYTSNKETLQSYIGQCNSFSDGKYKNTSSIIIHDKHVPIPGNSGCPVVDEHENIVGIFYGVPEENPNKKTRLDYVVAYFIRIDYLLPIIEESIKAYN